MAALSVEGAVEGTCTSALGSFAVSNSDGIEAFLVLPCGASSGSRVLGGVETSFSLSTAMVPLKGVSGGECRVDDMNSINNRDTTRLDALKIKYGVDSNVEAFLWYCNALDVSATTTSDPYSVSVDSI